MWLFSGVDFAENLNSIRQRMIAACNRAGRAPDSVTLLAVSKTHPPETIREAVNCGQIFFGENKLQEARAKNKPTLLSNRPTNETHLNGAKL